MSIEQQIEELYRELLASQTKAERAQIAAELKAARMRLEELERRS